MTQGGDGGDQALRAPADFLKTRQGLEQLRTKLNTAYQSAIRIGAIAAADKADQALDEVKAMLIKLDLEAAAARGEAMQAATADLKKPLKHLKRPGRATGITAAPTRASGSPQRKISSAKEAARTHSRSNTVPATLGTGRLSLSQVRRAVFQALRGKVFEPDA